MPTRSGPARLNRPAIKEAIVVDTYRGSVRVRAWPKKRGKPKSQHTKYMNAWMKDIARKIKFADAQAVDHAIKATKGTGLYPRDLIMSAATRGLYEIGLPDGKTVELKQQGLQQVAFQGCIIVLAADFAVPGAPPTIIPWNLPTVDTVGLWSVAAPTRITIPAGVNIARMTAKFIAFPQASAIFRMTMLKNTTISVAWRAQGAETIGAGVLDTGPIPVVAGDFFEVQHVGSVANTFKAGEWTGFACEVLAADFGV